MTAVRSLLVFALGFFALLAQTLLARDFLTAFEGNELGVATFFGSWLLWVAAGALAGRAAAGLAPRFAPLTLLYLPAFALEHYLIAGARELAGVTAYELFPFGRMVALALVTNAPVSLVTGFLFTLACRWWAAGSRPGDLPVARVYVLETLGAAAGGLAVTAMLGRGAEAATACLAGALLLAVGMGLNSSGRVLRWIAALAILLALVTGQGETWAAFDARRAWSRLLPEDGYRGHFTTAQARYLHGEREGQFVVVSAGGTVETLPPDEHAAKIAAVSLAEHPHARRVLVIGPHSLGLCLALRSLPSVERVTWLHPDPDYPAALTGVLPARFRPGIEGVEMPARDVREYLEQSRAPPDLVILNLPDATTLVLNRYFTQEFFALVKRRLAPDGVVALRVTGGSNYIGGELACLGASALSTFRSHFARVALEPGEESWLFGSDSEEPSESPARLRDRFAALEGAARLYPPEGLLSLFPPERIAFQRGRYEEVIAASGPELLLNTDDRPKALLYSLLVLLRQTGVRGVVGNLSVALRGGPWILAAALLLYAVLRLVYRGWGSRRGTDPAAEAHDGTVLVFATGAAGMGLAVWLMFAYQARFGSLFLHVGLISALFMLGSWLGSLLLTRWFRGRTGEPAGLLPVLIGLHVAVLAGAVAVIPVVSVIAYGAMVVLAGAFTGVYFPLAAHRLRAADREDAVAGSVLETADHLGAAAGSVLTGLFLLPLFGGSVTAALLALLVGINAAPIAVRARAPVPARKLDGSYRPLGYALFGVGVFALVASWLVAELRRGEEARGLTDAARTMTGAENPEEKTALTADGVEIRYFSARNPERGEEAFVFGTAGLAPGVYGYGGPIELAVGLDRAGRLLDVRVLRSRETPAYLERVRPWMRSLAGRELFATEPLAGVDTVSGATLTCNALRRTLERSARAFGAAVLGIEPGAESRPETAGPPVDTNFAWLALFLAAAVALRFRPHRWLRRAFLAAVVVVLGAWLNLQFATQHVFSLLAGDLPFLAANAAFFMIAVVPLVTVLVGNVYCGWMCPFGALQELVGELRPRRVDTDPDKAVWRHGRFVKYKLLLLLALVFAVTRDYSVLAADPLTTVFSAGRGGTPLLIAVGALGLAVVFRRFWCRNLCPAGAFLSLLNGLRLIRRLSPDTRPAACDLGVRHGRELDCLRCDRCLHATD